MGTNFYAIGITDPDTDNPDLHIGKSSVGWEFLFHDCMIGEADLSSARNWYKFLAKAQIRNEYGDQLHREELFEIVERHKGLLHGGRPDPEVGSFHYGEFC